MFPRDVLVLEKSAGAEHVSNHYRHRDPTHRCHVVESSFKQEVLQRSSTWSSGVVDSDDLPEGSESGTLDLDQFSGIGGTIIAVTDQ